MRIGPERHFDREASLHDWAANTGEGPMALRGMVDLPDGLIDFCRSFYAPVGAEEPPEGIVRMGAWITYMAIDSYDPYALLCGTSDVDSTEDWCLFTYEVTDPDGKKHEITNPEYLETFRHIPGQDERRFREQLALMATPTFDGIKSLPWDMAQFVEEYWEDNDVLGELDATERAWINARDNWRPYFDLAIWTSWLWFSGPLGRDFRYNRHPIFNAALSDGEVLLYEGGIIEAGLFTKLPRAPKSCMECGLDSWCVEMTYLEGLNRFLCEKHMNGSTPLFYPANCGSRACHYPSCPNHPLHGQSGAMHETLTGRGQLHGLGSRGPGMG